MGVGAARSNGADRHAHRRRRLRSAVLSGQQPHPRDVVSAARAGPRQLGLFGRHERRPRLPERAAVLDHAAIRLARPVLDRRRRWASRSASSGGRSIAIRARARPSTARSSTTSRPAAAANTRDSRSTSSGATSARLLQHRQVIGASIGQFGGNSTLVFFVTWFPTYLVTARGMTFIKAGFMTSLPYIARRRSACSLGGSCRTRS